MSPRTYAAALNEVLKPMGFVRQGDWWSRQVGEVLEQVDLQTSVIAGKTANLWSKNLETERLLSSIVCETPLRIFQLGMRIGELSHGRDKWWLKDPNGPDELAAAVADHAEPWFATRRTLEGQARSFGRGGARPWWGSNTCALAATLFRLGEIDEALALFTDPPPRTLGEVHIQHGLCMRSWLEGQKQAAAALARREPPTPS